MRQTTSILVGSDPHVARIVLDAVGQTKKCAFTQVGSVPEAIERIRQGGIGLALVHIRGADEVAVVRRFMRSLLEYKQTIPTLVLVEEADPELSLSLLKMGVVECLAR